MNSKRYIDVIDSDANIRNSVFGNRDSLNTECFSGFMKSFVALKCFGWVQNDPCERRDSLKASPEYEKYEWGV